MPRVTSEADVIEEALGILSRDTVPLQFRLVTLVPGQPPSAEIVILLEPLSLWVIVAVAVPICTQEVFISLYPGAIVIAFPPMLITKDQPVP